ncbi:complement C3-like isoform X2 [Lytechinus pictus]|uniref:complement C3-like isoform X2 n=1 Tax=Lytechinus pictus TaxID=7653 RepID=UPI0030B9B9F3
MEVLQRLILVLFASVVGLVSTGSAQDPTSGKIFVTAPNVLRIGVNETVTVSVFNTEPEEDVEVTVYIRRSRREPIEFGYSYSTVAVRRGTPVTTTVQVGTGFYRDLATEGNGYANLVVSAPSLGFLEEKEILLSNKSGYVLLHTDKPIYTPNQEVKIRLVAVDQDMKPSSELVHMMIVNPQGIIVEQFRETRAVNGFLDKTFTFDTEPMFGNWSVTVLHGHEFEKNKTVKFEVREYVLPRFTIKINTPDFIIESSSQESLDINFEAKHIYKKPVEGTYYMEIGILQRDGSVVSKSTTAGTLLNGIGTSAIYPRYNFGHDWFRNYEGCRLNVEVRVTESSTGVTEGAVDISTMIVQSPYRFKTGQTIRYFKPALPYEVQFELETVLGKPAQYLPVNVEASALVQSRRLTLNHNMDPNANQQWTDANGRVKFIFNTTHDTSQINIRVSTEERIERENAVFQFDANPYQSPADDDYLSISIAQTHLRVGDAIYAVVRTTATTPIDNLNLLFLSQGKVILAKSIDHVISNHEEVFFSVTSDMVPIVRIIAYYINHLDQVIADSIALKIENTCKHHVAINIQEEPNNEGAYLPESPVTLLVDAYPTSYVGLLGVDKAVYALNNNHRLSRRKMFEMMQTYDVGCGPGGGPTTPLIFKDSGLSVLTNARLAVPPREGLTCQRAGQSSRRKRSAVQCQSNTRSRIEQCLYQLERSGNCDDNLTTNRMFNRIQRWCTCETIASKLASKVPPYCPQATQQDIEDFTRCCELMNIWRLGGAPGVDVVDSMAPYDYADDSLSTFEEFGTDVRTDFKETWLFDLIRVGAHGQEAVDLQTPGSITEWSLQAVSVTPTGGLCVTDPLDVNVFKSLSIQLQLPYSVVRLEQIEVLATVYNYNPQGTNVRVSFYNPRGACGESSDPSQPATRVVHVPGHNSQSLKFVIVPVEIGELPITVTAISDLGSDGVQKTLNVIAHGIPHTVDHSVLLDPSGIYHQQRRSPRLRAAMIDDIQSDLLDTDNGVQYNILDLRPPDNIIPGTESAVLTLIGNMLGPILVDPVSNYGEWLQFPRGCGEQTMSIVAPTIFVHKYLLTMKLMNASLEEMALDRISRGLASALAHRRDDGSFSIWGVNESYNSSTWLTSFVLKVFSHASQIAPVDMNVTCKAAEWLIMNAQHPNGSFSELYKVHHKELTGGVSGEASMTAYVLISLYESTWCDRFDRNFAAAINDARAFLERQVKYLTRPYAKAIVTYALALSMSQYAEESNRMLRNDAITLGDGSRHWTPDESDLTNEDLPHWYRFRPSAIEVETTAYALLAQLQLRDISYAGSIALWLSQQQNYEGGFISTQDTVIALQALTRYSDMAHSGGDIDLSCVVTSTVDESFRFEHHFLPHNALVQREIAVPVGGPLRSQCEGKGTAKLAVRMKFSRLPSSHDVCPFNVTYNAREARTGLEVTGIGRSRVGIIPRSTTTSAQMARAKGDFVATIRFCARYTQNTRTNMGIIDVGLYSGFVLVSNRLEDMVQTDHLHLVQRYEVSQRSVIFYLDRIPADQDICMEFNARREIHVGNVQPVAIRVYDYYSPDKSCTSFYHPLEGNTQLPTLCNSADQCICPSERCAMCNRENGKNLLTKACESRDNYALRVRMVSQERISGYTVYTGNVTKVIKTGQDDVSAGMLRQFYIKERCPCPRIKLNNEHTIIGSAGLGFISDSGAEGYNYLLDERSVVEWWPTKLSKRKNADIQRKLLKFEQDVTDSRDEQNCPPMPNSQS